MKRSLCTRCSHPTTTCYCHTLRSVTNDWPVLILQHPNEAKHALGTARIAALSLTTCIITTMAIYADFKEFEIISIEAETTKHMMSDPRRIGKISAIINITLPSTATDRMQEGLKRVAHTCPVSKSLHPEIEQDVQINIELAS